MISEELLEFITNYFINCAPYEGCGLLVKEPGSESPIFVPCKNNSTAISDFNISAMDYAAAEDLGKIVAIAHSHPNASSDPSMADRVACNTSQLPWLIIGLPSKTYSWIYPDDYQAPYLEREFVYGVFDCYTLIQDWYKRERGVILPSFNTRYGWWLKGENHYIDNFALAGFTQLPSNTSPEEGDVFLMQIRSPVPSHAALYIGEGLIMQHMVNTLSKRYVYGGTWAQLTTNHLRLCAK